MTDVDDELTRYAGRWQASVDARAVVDWSYFRERPRRRRFVPVLVGMAAAVAAVTVVALIQTRAADASRTAGIAAASTSATRTLTRSGESSTTAVSGPTPGSLGPTSAAEWEAQARLSAVQAEINTGVSTADPGYNSTAFNTAEQAITIFRSGPLSATAQAFYDSLHHAGVTLIFAPALLSLTQVNQLATKVEGMRKQLEQGGTKITQIEQTGGGPLVVGYDPSFATPNPALLADLQTYGANTVVFAPIDPAHPLSSIVVHPAQPVG